MRVAAEVDEIGEIIATWPPARPVELSDAQFSVWVARHHLDRIKRQFETGPEFDRVFLYAAAQAAQAETPVAEGSAAARHDLAAVMAAAGGVRFRKAPAGYDHSGPLREIAYWALVSAHQNTLGMLTTSRAQANAELNGNGQDPAQQRAAQ